MKLKTSFLFGVALGGGIGLWLAQNYQIKEGGLKRIPVAIQADGGIYSGALDAEGLFTGQGRLEWTNGSYYEGGFKTGQFNGRGKFVRPSGYIAEGEFVDGQLTGKGRIEFKDGTYYEGEFKDDLKHGQGQLVYSSGTTWEGGFEADRISGSGTWRTPAGLVYRGEMKEGKFHGRGEATYPDKSHYVGEFHQGKRHGEGLFRSADGTEYSGDFTNNEFSGSGSITWPEERGQYVGAVANWQPEGKGITTNLKGRALSGIYRDGRLNGSGEYRAANGEHYQGQFENGQYSGQGIWTDKEGNRYEGEFIAGDFHGPGRYTYAEPLDGITSFSGVWSWGRLISGDENLHIHPPDKISEHFLYHQSAQLERALSGLKAGDPEKIELYALGLGGDGNEEVFNREINYIESKLNVLFNTEQRALFFSNSRRNLEDRPMATITSLERGLQALAAKMNRDQDILFLYLTTHGSEDHRLSFDQSGLDLPDLSADELADMLDNSGIKWKVVVLSACYSGGFIEPLKNEQTLILTAAAADKTSFGCSDNRQFTYFGDALFQQSLAKTDSFSAAFDQAVTLINEWENEEELEPSNPQSHQPEPIMEQLRRWRRTLVAN